MRILLVEDDETIVEVITAILGEQHYVVDVATDGEAGWDLIEAFPYDLVLLDVGLPKLDGIAFCRKLRQQKNQVLVMLLTARDTTTDKLIGLDAGADDYLVKPFDAKELAARIRALLRRGNTLIPSILSCGNLRLDPSACEVTYAGKPLRFSRKEYLLLELFLRQQNRVFSRSTIVNQIWSFSEDPPNEDTVKSHIKSVRRKLDTVGIGDLIETLYGQGYRINPAYIASSSNPASTPAPTPVNLPAVPVEPAQPTPAKPTAAKQQTLERSVAEIWQRTKTINMQRVEGLEQVVQSLQAGNVTPELWQQGVQNAHKLAGSLGTFGYETGSQLAQQMEILLQPELETPAPVGQQQLAGQMEQLISALRDELAAAPQWVASPQVPTVVENNGSSQSLPLLLIAEPDVAFAEAITTEAASYGLRTLTVETLSLAQQYCQQERPSAVVMDFALLQMAADRADPDRTTCDCAALLASLQAQPPVPILFLSTDASVKERVAAAQAGGTLFFAKPTSPTLILQAVTDLLHPLTPTPPKVLVVDDDPLIITLLSECLEPHGIQLSGLEDSTQFWQVLNTVEPHLVILDVNMPEVDGIGICQTIRSDSKWNWLPILFLTAQSDPQTHQQIFQMGADDLLIKPVVPFEVCTRVLNRLRRCQFYQPQHTAQSVQDTSLAKARNR